MNRCRSDYCSDYKRQKIKFRTGIATNVATTESKVQRTQIFCDVRNGGMRLRLRFRLFLLRKKSASIAFWYQNAACRENPGPNAASGRKINS